MFGFIIMNSGGYQRALEKAKSFDNEGSLTGVVAKAEYSGVGPCVETSSVSPLPKKSGASDKEEQRSELPDNAPPTASKPSVGDIAVKFAHFTSRNLGWSLKESHGTSSVTAVNDKNLGSDSTDTSPRQIRVDKRSDESFARFEQPGACESLANSQPTNASSQESSVVAANLPEWMHQVKVEPTYFRTTKPDDQGEDCDVPVKSLNCFLSPNSPLLEEARSTRSFDTSAEQTNLNLGKPQPPCETISTTEATSQSSFKEPFSFKRLILEREPIDVDCNVDDVFPKILQTASKEVNQLNLRYVSDS